MLFEKLPIQIQSQLTMAGKQNADIDKIKMFITRQCQYEQLLSPSVTQLFSQASTAQHFAPTEPQQGHSNYQQPSRPKYKTTGECHYCGKIGHNAFECRTRKREEKQQPNNDLEQQNSETKPK